MAPAKLALAFGLLVSTPGFAAPSEPAPAGTAETKYCMKVEAPANSRIEPIECWTRAEWADQGVDVDKDWPKEGVAVIG